MSLLTKDEIQVIELLSETDASIHFPILEFTKNEINLKDNIGLVKAIQSSFDTILEAIENSGEHLPEVFRNGVVKVVEKMLSFLNTFPVKNEQEKNLVKNAKNAAKAIFWEIDQQNQPKSRGNWDIVIGEQPLTVLFAESQKRIHLLGED